MNDLKEEPLDQEDDEDSTTEHFLKLVVLGDCRVGKTSICSRYVNGQIVKEYRPTVGLDFFSKCVELPGRVLMSLQIWDIGGRTLAGPMLDKYVYGANGAMLVYDMTSEPSFLNLENWIAQLVEFTSGQPKAPILMLIGNKSDQEYMRAIKMERHLKFAEKYRMLNFLVSAKLGDGLTLPFITMGSEILGIPLTSSDVEQSIAVVRAELPFDNRGSHSNGARTRRKTTQSNVCCMQ
ncbi:unnamed protein product [Soboliphyme baturini]|uniref:Ras-related protein Rab-28 n=1 Tax=Soboliphyme baturini TaxID=241478 RepID=A0A183J0T0_9BILA|nr:unnamed protein product [Soboliphyme baturini]